MQDLTPSRLAVGLALAATITAAARAAQQPQFRARVDLVEIDAAVLDRQGRPVTNLTAADFDVREGGVLQRIETFALVTGGVTERAPRPAAETPVDPSAPAVRQPLPPRIFIFVFDLAHLSTAGLERSRTAVKSFLEDGLRPQDLAGIVADERMLGNRIVSDKRALLTELDRVGPPNAGRFNEMRQWPRILNEEEAARIARGNREVLKNALQRACQERPDECNTGEHLLELKSRQILDESRRDAQTTLTVLQTLATGLRKYPGPKQVVFFSEGFYSDEFANRVTQVAGQASLGRVRISTIDARGLLTDPRQRDLFEAQPLAGTGDLAAAGMDVTADALTTLAAETGGERIRNRNNLRPALDRVATTSGTYYLLGYRPQTPLDGSYRSVEVRVRRPDVTVIARRGYLAVEERAAAPATAAPLLPSAQPPANVGAKTEPPGAAAAAPPAIGAETPSAPRGVVSTVRPGVDRTASAAEAARRLTPTAAASADRAVALARQGWDAYSTGDVERARALLAEASTAGGGVWVDYVLGFTELALDRPDAAIVAWTRVREARPDHQPVYFDLADAYLRAVRSADALAVLRDAARRWPSDPETHNAVGVVLLGRGAIDDAIESFERAVAAAPGDSLGYFNLGRARHARYVRLLGSVGPGSATAARTLADRERRQAAEAYTKYLALGGAYERQAREALTLLGWGK